MFAQAFIFLKLATRTSDTNFGPEIQIGVCETCWFNLQRYLPGFFRSAPAWEKAGTRLNISQSLWICCAGCEFRDRQVKDFAVQ